MGKKTAYLIIGVVAVIIGAIFFSVRNKPVGVQPFLPLPGNTGQTPVPPYTPLIEKAVMSKSIDANGNATGVTTIFNAKTDKIVYAVLSLKNVTQNTKLSYVRYLNGKYVDSKVASPSKNNITTFFFVFEKGIGNYPTGTYTLKLYVNGKYSQSLTYVFK